MHSEIAITQGRILELFHAQRAYLAGKPLTVLEELLHRAEELMRSEDFSVRTAAEINYAACVFVLGRNLLPQGKR